MTWAEIPRAVIFSIGFFTGVVFVVTTALVYAFVALDRKN